MDSYIISRNGRRSDYLIDLRPWKDIKAEMQERINNISYTAITITFKTSLCNALDEQQLMHMVVVFLNESSVKHFTLFPDVSPSGQFHYHGVIQIKTKDKPLFKRRITRNIGFVKLDYISDTEGWYKYCRKAKGFCSKEHPEPLEEPIYTREELTRLLISDVGRFQQI